MAKKEVKEKDEKPITIESPIKSGISDTTRGLIIGFAVAFVIALIIFLLVFKKEDNDNRSKALVEFYEYFESDEKTLIVFASSECAYCVAQEPIVHAIAEEYDLNYLYMDYLELESNEEVDQVVKALKVKGSTPTSVIVQNGEVLHEWVGYVDGETYVANLVAAGLLEENTEYNLEDNITSIDYKKFKSLLNDSKTSAIIVDIPTCALCYSERLELNEIARKHNVPVYRLSAEVLTEEEMTAFTDGLGEWGFTSSDYESNKNVQVPLLLFVKNGKISSFNIGYVEGETDLENLFKEAGLIK